MRFRVEITPVAEAQIEGAYRWYREVNRAFADRWFRELMNRIASLHDKPERCALAVENEIFSREIELTVTRTLTPEGREKATT